MAEMQWNGKGPMEMSGNWLGLIQICERERHIHVARTVCMLPSKAPPTTCALTSLMKKHLSLPATPTSSPSSPSLLLLPSSPPPSFIQIAADWEVRPGKKFVISHRPRSGFEVAVAKDLSDFHFNLILRFHAGKVVVGELEEVANDEFPEWKPNHDTWWSGGDLRTVNVK